MKRALDRSLQEETLALEASGLRRSVERTPDRQSAFDFTSNDYLGLATHPAVLAASTAAIEEHGCGARASRLLGGGSPWEESAEARLASWLNAESALLFPTGYQANLGLVTSLAESGDALLSDAKVHASMIDACRLSKAQKHIFQHNNLEELERLLVATAGARRRFVLVEAIYSMDGDSAPIDALNDLCVRHDAWLLVDEAHSIGVCGEHGEGLACPSDARPLERVYARVVTGGKALGCAGGFVVGSSDLRNLLIHRARSFIFTT
ncbi:MAG: pyridoxal phosphate-dependent aminotransferase family protein, partial [Planctomycetota bacterium]|nr:pyridoxal phosphate-dependent aminotransferase family protein [Planctomycetota bacterium]